MVGLPKALRDKGKGAGEVALISINLDPERDKAEALKSWSKDLGAKPGLTLVTGTRQDKTWIGFLPVFLEPG